MDIQNICIKFYANGGEDFDQDVLIPVFQDWIKHRSLDEVLIDIADYNLVPNGPGIMLICHHANYHMDAAEDGRLGLLVQRKQPQEGDHQTRILGVLRSGLAFLKQLKADPRTPADLSFDLGGFEYIANDRLRLENSDAAAASIRGDLQAVAARLYPGQSATIERRVNHPRARLAVRVTVGASPDIETLLQRLAA